MVTVGVNPLCIYYIGAIEDWGQPQTCKFKWSQVFSKPKHYYGVHM